MRTILLTSSQAHTFDHARVLAETDELAALFSGYPKNILSKRGIEGAFVRSHPYPFLLYSFVSRYLKIPKIVQGLFPWQHQEIDRYASTRLPDAELLISTADVGIASGRAAKSRGIYWLCDRPASHIVVQDEILIEEGERTGRVPRVARPLMRERELAEYEDADAIMVPSEFARRTFLAQGVPAGKIWMVPYGVDVSRFRPQGAPDPAGPLEICFAGVVTMRKGLHYLVEAFDKLPTKHKRLTLAGYIDSEMIENARKLNARDDIDVLGPVSQERLTEIFSRSHAMVLPSVEDGYGMVTAQAMACGCPAVVSRNAGSADIVQNGVDGFTYEVRDTDTLAAALQRFADERDLRDRMSGAALAKARSLGGWETYAEEIRRMFRERR